MGILQTFATWIFITCESGIMDDLGLSIAGYSVFSSLLTLGATISGVTSGRTTDLIGPRGTMWLSEIFCSTGWLAIVFSKVSYLFLLFFPNFLF
ncbi:Sugar transporter ERD6-like 3 [Vitis vinifera]|uniref:Sugar transporter ERD6-like 3 n=1 Tax=Vitis vinifera TaxID=29760 RepID=A0A438F170_VITVI|nr:Sugar transporter ERD6-like 3 [Vitis vinifera]